MSILLICDTIMYENTTFNSSRYIFHYIYIFQILSKCLFKNFVIKYIQVHKLFLLLLYSLLLCISRKILHSFLDCLYHYINCSLLQWRNNFYFCVVGPIIILFVISLSFYYKVCYKKILPLLISKNICFLLNNYSVNLIINNIQTIY